MFLADPGYWFVPTAFQARRALLKQKRNEPRFGSNGRESSHLECRALSLTDIHSSPAQSISARLLRANDHVARRSGQQLDACQQSKPAQLIGACFLSGAVAPRPPRVHAPAADFAHHQRLHTRHHATLYRAPDL